VWALRDLRQKSSHLQRSNGYDKVKSIETTDTKKEDVAVLKAVLKATGGDAKVRELFQLLSAEEAAEFLALDLDTISNLTYRRELPCVKVGPRV
jgi:hypothetical protein